MKDAWAVPARGLGSLSITTATDDEAAKKLLQQAQEYASGLSGQMSSQRDAFNDANAAKMDVSSFA